MGNHNSIRSFMKMILDSVGFACFLYDFDFARDFGIWPSYSLVT